jgi:hypothetical protein
MITITISPQTGDQIRIIAAAMIELLSTAPAEVATAETATTSVKATFPTPAATEPAKTRKKPASPAPAPAAEQPAAEQPAAAAPTLEEVRAKLTIYKDSGKSLKDLLATVDSPHLLAVTPERYSELLANMEKM